MHLYACNIHDLETILTDILCSISRLSSILHSIIKFESIYFSPGLGYPTLLSVCYWYHSQLL